MYLKTKWAISCVLAEALKQRVLTYLWEIMYSYWRINSVADLVITFTVTDDFALTPAGEHFDCTFHAAKCRTYSPTLPFPALFPFSSVPLLTLCCCCCCFFFLVPASFHHCIFFFFFLGLLLYLLTIIMYISQSGSGTSGRGCEKALRGSPPPRPHVLLYLCVSDARDIAVMK